MLGFWEPRDRGRLKERYSLDTVVTSESIYGFLSVTPLRGLCTSFVSWKWLCERFGRWKQGKLRVLEVFSEVGRTNTKSVIVPVHRSEDLSGLVTFESETEIVSWRIPFPLTKYSEFISGVPSCLLVCEKHPYGHPQDNEVYWII